MVEEKIYEDGTTKRWTVSGKRLQFRRTPRKKKEKTGGKQMILYIRGK